MTNRLAQENSPYLLQHAENAVDWYPWGEEALAKAHREQKPIFLSIGYAACHWCHVMAHESFEDPQTAGYLNEHFVNIKVDREERPDLDSIYMNAVVAITGQGGWPMSVFLTPDLKPFYGGTYFPPVPRYNMPSFRDLLATIVRLWTSERERLLKSAEEVSDHLQQAVSFPGNGSPLSEESLKEASLRLAQGYDWKNGGWGAAPKFPQPMTIEFLLLRARKGDSMARDVAVHALHAMAKGGMYDVVGGGFARYSTDDTWLVPHFEKMLYDNAQLARVYLHAFLITRDESFHRVCTETLDFIVRELMEYGPDGERLHGGFLSSLDADSEGEEGKFYVWTPGQVRQAFTDLDDAEFLIAAYQITDQGNFEGRTVLQRALSDDELAAKFGIPAEQVAKRLQRLHARLLEVRSQRVRPGTDNKVLVAWNALALSAFAEAARYLQRPDYLEVARLNADFLLTELALNDGLLRSWRLGQARHAGYLEDYAGLILGLLALYQSDPDSWWFSSARQLAADMLDHYRDPQGGFFDTRADQRDLLTRPKDLQDNATPSGNALAALALLQLSTYTGDGEWRDLAETALRSIQETAAHYPTAFAQWLNALAFAAGPVQEVAILGDPDQPAAAALISALWSDYRPLVLAAVSPFPPPENAPPLLQDRPLVDGGPAAYVCRQFVCQRPVTSPAELQKLLE